MTDPELSAGRARPVVRRVTVGFPQTAHYLVDSSAKRDGVSLAQYLRESALMRMGFEAALAYADADPEVREAYLREMRELRAALDPRETGSA